jgi:hypothetical protein
MAYEIDWQGRVVYVRLSGVMDVNELARAVNEIAASAEFDGQRFQVVDFGAATLPPLNPLVFRALAPVIGATVTNPCITAIVVPDTAPVRAFTTFCSPVLRGLRSVQFLRDRAQADDWISEQTMTEQRL